MHAYRILLPSETDDSRFNSREKHVLTDSVQPYNKQIIDLVALSILKNLGLIFHSTDRTSKVNKPLIYNHYKLS